MNKLSFESYLEEGKEIIAGHNKDGVFRNSNWLINLYVLYFDICVFM